MSRLSIYIVLIVLVSEVSLSPFDFFKRTQYRLPNSTVPLEYDIHITSHIHEENFEFSGTVIITLKAVVNTNNIVFHAVDFQDIKLSLIEKQSGLEFKGLKYKLNRANDFITIFAEPEPLNIISGKEYVLTISYTGNHGYRPKGFFASTLQDSQGHQIWLATTQFEPVYARYAFPCYDEPAIKAKFTISITHSKSYIALSNMPEERKPIEELNGMITTKFMQSPPMSTYTVAFLVTNYKNISLEFDRVTHRVFSPPMAKKEGQFSLDVASKALHNLEDYFGLQYPLPKMDHISIPNLSFSAMENWGLIIYRYGYLLPSSETSHLYNIDTANVIVHELTHQWFGNLVSPKWWKWTWLNEGLTTFYSDKILKTIFPDWEAIEYGLYRDGRAIVWEYFERQPLTQDVETTAEILTTFSLFSYHKAAYILHMFEHALSENTFRKGITAYLKKFQYSTAEESDLFECLEEAAIEDKSNLFGEKGILQTIMSSWTNQKSYPVINAIRDYQSGTFTIQQIAKTDKSSGWFNKLVNFFSRNKNQYWWIPITFATTSRPDFSNTTVDLLFSNTTQMVVDPSSINRTLLQGDWLVLNKQQIGLYRINYDERNWALIAQALKSNPKAIHPYNKAQLIRDSVYFYNRKELSEKVFFDFLRYLKKEDEILPWVEATIAFKQIIEKLEDTDQIENLKIFFKDIASDMYKNIGIVGNARDPPMVEYLRPKLFNLACEVGLEDCKAILEQKYEDALQSDDTMSPYMVSAVLCEFVKTANDEEMENFYRQLRSNKPRPFDRRDMHLIEIVLCKPNVKLAKFLLTYLDIDISELLRKAILEDL